MRRPVRRADRPYRPVLRPVSYTHLDVYKRQSPDVASIQPDWWPSLIVKNYFQEISVGNFDLANDPAYDLDSMNLCSWGGKYHGVSIKNSTWCNAMHVILYNKTLFRRENLETPTELWIKNEWNWDTYLKAAKALSLIHI